MKRLAAITGFALFLSQAPASAKEIPPQADFRATPPERLHAGISPQGVAGVGPA